MEKPDIKQDTHSIEGQIRQTIVHGNFMRAYKDKRDESAVRLWNGVLSLGCGDEYDIDEYPAGFIQYTHHEVCLLIKSLEEILVGYKNIRNNTGKYLDGTIEKYKPTARK